MCDIWNNNTLLDARCQKACNGFFKDFLKIFLRAFNNEPVPLAQILQVKYKYNTVRVQCNNDEYTIHEIMVTAVTVEQMINQSVDQSFMWIEPEIHIDVKTVYNYGLVQGTDRALASNVCRIAVINKQCQASRTEYGSRLKAREYT